MKKLFAFFALLLAVSCNKTSTAIKDVTVDLCGMEWATGIDYGISAYDNYNRVILEEPIEFPIRAEHCKIVVSIPEKCIENVLNDRGYYDLDAMAMMFEGKVTIYDEHNNLFAEWTNKGDSYIYDFKLYKTERKKTYCFVEILGELSYVEGGFGNDWGSTLMRKRYALDDNGKPYLMSELTNGPRIYEFTEYYPSGQKKRYFLKRAVGEVQGSIDSEEGLYYNMETVADEYYNADGSAM